MKQQIFIENIQMETQTVFCKNGNISIHPCGFELGQQTLSGGRDQVSQKGRMVTDADGTSHFRAYRKDSGCRYTPLMTTPHGEVKHSRRDIIVKLQLPKCMGRWEVCDAIEDELDSILEYLETTDELWQ